MTTTDLGQRGVRSARNLIPAGKWRRLTWAGIDAVLWMSAVMLGCLLRYDFELGDIFFGRAILFGLIVAGLMVGAGLLIGPYRVGHRRGSYEEITGLGRAVLIVTVAATLLNLVLQLVPRSVPVIAAMVAMSLMLAARMLIRALDLKLEPGAGLRPVLIYGAGNGGRLLVRALLTEDHATLRPVGIIDDAPQKRRLSIDGVRVRGTLENLPEIVRETEAVALAIAIPSADSELITTVRELAKQAGIEEVLIMPSTTEMISGRRGTDLRRLDLADLLGRRPVELDAEAIRAQIAGKTVLVTGAGGSIGSELARQIALFNPGKLYLLDRDESALHGTQLSMHGRALLDDDTLVLADIRDADRLYEVFRDVRPEVVFHAAALKHLPLLERFPEEAWKSNVHGTLNVLNAAYDVGVATFVNISTDKAANPISVLGYSKRLTERLTSDFAHRDSGVYVSVRFGNVLGSRGSVLTAFTSQIENGGPVTVTHPDVERYFMLIPEACQLVLQAAAIGIDGEVMVLDMGRPAKIAAVAKTLIELSGRDIAIEYTGLRPGEKMSEELFDPDEVIASSHPLVSHVAVPSMSDREVEQTFTSDSELVEWMRTQATRGV